MLQALTSINLKSPMNHNHWFYKNRNPSLSPSLLVSVPLIFLGLTLLMAMTFLRFSVLGLAATKVLARLPRDIII